MNNKLDKLKNNFFEKQKVLESARIQLKTEYIGINSIIDEIVDNVSSWFLLPELQEKPVIVNLWGLTGVGKTSVVNRLVELIEFSDKYYRFDLGEKKGSFSFRDSLEDLCENSDDSPVMVALDEFQHSRTLVGPAREEIESDDNRMIWELLDSGKVSYIEWKSGLWSFEELISKLYYLIQAGVKVEKGCVITQRILYCHELEIANNPSEKIPFVPENYYENIKDFAGKPLGIHLLRDVKEILMALNGEETLQFLGKVFKLAKRPMVKNFSKALIFVMGNLDEAYQMSGNFSADIDANEFHKLSLKINIPQVKQALQERFRNEQIARLGNIHIIYPALNCDSYKQIIRMNLNKIAASLKESHGIELIFDQSVHQLIYDEGVYPTQGVRPIFTTIHQVLKSKLSFFIAEMLLKTVYANKLIFSVQKKTLTCDYYQKTKLLFSKNMDIITNLGELRSNKRDDMQAITAVHESGHAILMALLLRTIPEVMYSISTDADNEGFVYSVLPWDYTAKNEMIPRVAMLLGGHVAEELIFGLEKVTTGSRSDIQKATQFLSEMIKTCGMGELPLSYRMAETTDEGYYHNIALAEELIKEHIEAAKQMARETLLKEKQLLLVMADYLSDNRMLKREEIRTMVKTHAKSTVSFIETGDLIFYRDHLKRQVVSEKEVIRNFAPSNPIMLNNDKSNSF
jgi:cell division protease FtsH